jgi:hypothetical protein
VVADKDFYEVTLHNSFHFPNCNKKSTLLGLLDTEEKGTPVFEMLVTILILVPCIIKYAEIEIL